MGAFRYALGRGLFLKVLSTFCWTNTDDCSKHVYCSDGRAPSHLNSHRNYYSKTWEETSLWKVKGFHRLVPKLTWLQNYPEIITTSGPLPDLRPKLGRKRTNPEADTTRVYIVWTSINWVGLSKLLNFSSVSSSSDMEMIIVTHGTVIQTLVFLMVIICWRPKTWVWEPLHVPSVQVLKVITLKLSLLSLMI